MMETKPIGPACQACPCLVMEEFRPLVNARPHWRCPLCGARLPYAIGKSMVAQRERLAAEKKAADLDRENVDDLAIFDLISDQ